MAATSPPDDLDEISGPIQPPPAPLVPADPADIARERARLSSADRDLAGFIEADSPHLSERQTVWLLVRAGTLTDAEACAVTAIPVPEAAAWRADPTFEAILQNSLANKREGFRALGTQLLPKVQLRLVRALESSSDKSAVAAAKLLLQSQGMLIDRSQSVNQDTVVELIAHLREPVPVEANVTPVRHRGIPSPNSDAD